MYYFTHPLTPQQLEVIENLTIHERFVYSFLAVFIGVFLCLFVKKYFR